jgi:integrase
MAALRARVAIAAIAFEFLILTNTRSDAVLKAKWNDFDLDQALWIVPLVNLKDRKHRKEGFRVPLSPRAVEIVRQMAEVRVSNFIFPGHTHSKPFSNMALLTVIKRMNSVSGEKWIDPTSGGRSPPTASGQRSGHGRRRLRDFHTRSSNKRWGMPSVVRSSAPIVARTFWNGVES